MIQKYLLVLPRVTGFAFTSAAEKAFRAFQYGVLTHSEEFIRAGIQVGMINISRPVPFKFFPIVSRQW